MNLKMAADMQRAEVSGSADLDASGLEALIVELAEMRARMLPPVPAHRSELEADRAVLIESEPGLLIAARADGGFRLWVRNRGFGWVAYEIGPREAAGMASYILSRADAKDVDLIGHEEPNRH